MATVTPRSTKSSPFSPMSSSPFHRILRFFKSKFTPAKSKPHSPTSDDTHIEVRAHSDDTTASTSSSACSTHSAAPAVFALSPAERKARAAANKKRFLSVWPRVNKELTDHLESLGLPESAVQWYDKNFKHNTPGGKLVRGITVIETVETLLNRTLEGEEFYRVAVLGWCIELLQGFFIIVDDIMDFAITRRDQICWHRVEDAGIYPRKAVGMTAINDGALLEQSLYHLLKVHFRQESCYVDLLEAFQEVAFLTEIGEQMDLINSPEDRPDLDVFSQEKFRSIAIHKTGYYTFYLPLALAFHYVGLSSEHIHQQAKAIMRPIGIYYQAQDDYLDVFGTHEQIGKIGTDIVDNKCTWCVLKAMELATPEQEQVLKEHYGRKNAESEALVKQVFRDVDLPGEYEKYQKEMYDEITALIEKVDEDATKNEEGVYVKKSVYLAQLALIHGRSR